LCSIGDALMSRTKRISPARFREIWMDHSISRDEAAARVGMSARYMQDIASRMGLPRRPNYSRPKVITNTALLRDMWAAGLSTRDIARAFNCGPQTVNRKARAIGLPSRHRGFTGRISLAEYMADTAILAMQKAARVEQAAIINAEMADFQRTGGHAIGFQHAKGLSHAS
jgi:hypothetical protein